VEESTESQYGLPVPGGLVNARGSPVSKIRILLVNSERLALEGMRRILSDYSEFSVVATARDGTSALRQIRVHRPHIVLIELGSHIPGTDGLEATRIIRRRHIHTKVVIMSSGQQPFYMREAFLAGAHGYLSKNINPGELRTSLQEVYRRGAVLPRDMASHVCQILSGRLPVDDDPLYGLNGRERQIFFMMAHGHDTRYIATALRLSPKTVRNYSSRIYKKLGTGNRLQTVLYAERWLGRAGRIQETE
jgi:DNA-binding NarL/FixJ family response regulator